MTDQTCKNCRWWGELTSESANGKRNCVCTKVNEGGQESDSGAFPWGDYALCVGFATGPDFGCIHFERKDDNG